MTATGPSWLVEGEMAIVAHRGGAALGRENSLEVLEAAQAAGAAAVEVDVHELGDGSLVLAHDGYVVDGKRWHWIRDLDRAQFEQLSGLPTTLLGDFLEGLRATTLGLYLEVKAASPAGLARLVSTVESARMAERTLAGSFRTDIVASIARDGRLPASVLFRDTRADPLALARDLGAHAVHPCFDDKPKMLDRMRGSWIERLHDAGLVVVGWNVNKRRLLDKMRELPLHAACTDDPRIAR